MISSFSRLEMFVAWAKVYDDASDEEDRHFHRNWTKRPLSPIYPIDHTPVPMYLADVLYLNLIPSPDLYGLRTEYLLLVPK